MFKSALGSRDDGNFIDYDLVDTSYNAIIIGSHARGEVTSTDRVETILIREGRVFDTNENGIILNECGINDVPPELILEAFTQHSHLREVLMHYKKQILESESVIPSLNKRRDEAAQVLSSGILRFKSEDRAQHIVNEDGSLSFFFDKESFGPKYGFLRYFQLATLSLVVRIEKRLGSQFFNPNFNIVPSVRNRIEYIKTQSPTIHPREFDKLTQSYNLLLRLYNNRNKSVPYQVNISEEVLNQIKESIELLESLEEEA
jgi:hypothetical protein